MEQESQYQLNTPENVNQPAAIKKIPAKESESQKIETACRKRIIELTEKQENELLTANERMEENHLRFIEFDKKWDLVKRSLKIAKKKKAAKSTIKLLKGERKTLKAKHREYRNLVEMEREKLDAMRMAIEMLKTLV